MAGLACPRPPVRSNGGFTLFEAVLALLLLATCLIPAAYALRDAVHAPGDATQFARNLDCVTALMETEIATPHPNLRSQAKTDGSATQLSIDADANCPARQVTLQLYGSTVNKKIGPGGNNPYLLYVSVSLADPADGNPFTLTTLVSQ
jgi:hypothetical protein